MRLAARAWSGFLILSIAGPIEILSEPESISSAPFESQVYALLFLWFAYGIVGAVASVVTSVIGRFLRSSGPGADAVPLLILLAMAADQLGPRSAGPTRALWALAALALGLLAIALLLRRKRWPLAPPLLVFVNGFSSLGIAHLIVNAGAVQVWDRGAAAPLFAIPGLALLWLIATRASGARRPVFGSALLGVGVILLAARVVSAGAPAHREEGMKSLVLITLDTFRADHVGAYGNHRVYTPNLDELAAEGTLFTSASSPIPLTYPAHASMLSGLYPGEHGVVANRAVPMPPRIDTLPLALNRAGYETGAFVSGYTLSRAQCRLFEQFETYDDDHSALGWLPERVMRTPLFSAVKRAVPGIRPKGKRDGQRTVEAATRWLRRNAEAPFFLWVHFYDPHGPYDAPPAYEAMYGVPDGASEPSWYGMSSEERAKLIDDSGRLEWMRRRYAAEVSYTDHQIGTLVSELSGLGALERTLIVITADHGESLTEHDYYFDHGECLYEQSLRVPLIIVEPRTGPAPGLREDPSELVDLMPTLLERLGMERPVRGAALLAPDYAARPDRPSVAAVFPGTVRASKSLLSITRGGVKYIRNGSRWGEYRRVRETEELYDLTNDPGESVNLIEQERELARELRDLAETVASGWAERVGAEAGVSEEQEEMLRSLGYIR